MKPNSSAQGDFAIPHYEPQSTPPFPDGFEGLNSAQRAARAGILCRAYSLWDCKGRPDDSALADWLEAEAQVLNDA